MVWASISTYKNGGAEKKKQTLEVQSVVGFCWHGCLAELSPVYTLTETSGVSLEYVRAINEFTEQMAYTNFQP